MVSSDNSLIKELLFKYGVPNITFDGLSWVAYMAGADMLSTITGEDPLEDEAYNALLEHIERKMWGVCILVEHEREVEQ